MSDIQKNTTIDAPHGEIDERISRLMNTISASVSPYHSVQEGIRQLSTEGFEELPLTEEWNLEEGGKYYVSVFDSSLFAFTIGSNVGIGKCSNPSLRMEAAHTDWPCLKIKPSPEMKSGSYAKINTEPYGGMVRHTWIDRPLGAAGKVCVKSGDAFAPEVKFINTNRPVMTIPGLAIHMDHSINENLKLNPQTDLIPLMGLLPSSGTNESSTGNSQSETKSANWFMDFLGQETGCEPDDILDYEIYLYIAEEPIRLGFGGEMLSAPRIDNTTSVQACLSGIKVPPRKDGINIITLYDNEEIGSRTKQGALSAVTERILEKIWLFLGYDRSKYLDAVMDGFLLSMDVAHAIHPNHGEKADVTNQIQMGDGLAIKMSARQSYATDASCISVVEGICQKNGIPYKKFANRSDIPGGSTLGALSSAQLSMKTVDLGVPQLSMHSARELMGCSDQFSLERLAEEFFK